METLNKFTFDIQLFPGSSASGNSQSGGSASGGSASGGSASGGSASGGSASGTSGSSGSSGSSAADPNQWTKDNSDPEKTNVYTHENKTVTSSTDPNNYTAVTAGSNNVSITSADYQSLGTITNNSTTEDLTVEYTNGLAPKTSSNYVYISLDANSGSGTDTAVVATQTSAGVWTISEYDTGASVSLTSFVVAGPESSTGQTLYLAYNDYASDGTIASTGTAVITGLVASGNTLVPATNDAYSAQNGQISIANAYVTDTTKVASANDVYAIVNSYDLGASGTTVAKYFLNDGAVTGTLALQNATLTSANNNLIGYYEGYKPHSAGTANDYVFAFTGVTGTKIADIESGFIEISGNAVTISDLTSETQLGILVNNTTDTLTFTSYLNGISSTQTSIINLEGSSQLDFNVLWSGTTLAANNALFVGDATENNLKSYVWLKEGSSGSLAVQGGVLHGVTAVSSDASAVVSDGTLVLSGFSFSTLSGGGYAWDTNTTDSNYTGISLIANSLINKVKFSADGQTYTYDTNATKTGNLSAEWTTSDNKTWTHNGALKFSITFSTDTTYANFVNTVTVNEAASSVTLQDSFFDTDYKSVAASDTTMFFNDANGTFTSRLYAQNSFDFTTGALTNPNSVTTASQAFVYDNRDSANAVFYGQGFYVNGVTPLASRILLDDFSNTTIYNYADSAANNSVRFNTSLFTVSTDTGSIRLIDTASTGAAEGSRWAVSDNFTIDSNNVLALRDLPANWSTDSSTGVWTYSDTTSATTLVMSVNSLESSISDINIDQKIAQGTDTDSALINEFTYDGFASGKSFTVSAGSATLKDASDDASLTMYAQLAAGAVLDFSSALEATLGDNDFAFVNGTYVEDGITVAGLGANAASVKADIFDETNNVFTSAIDPAGVTVSGISGQVSIAGNALWQTVTAVGVLEQINMFDGGAFNTLYAADGVNGFTVSGFTPAADGTGSTIEAGAFTFDALTDSVNAHIVFANDADATTKVNGLSLAQIDGDTTNGYELNLWSAVDGGYAFNNEITVTGISSYDTINVIDGGLNFVDSAASTNADIHILGTDKVSVAGAAVTLYDGDGNTVNGSELVPAPAPEVVTGWQTISGGFTYLDATTEGAAAFTVTGYTTDANADGIPDAISYDSVSGLTFGDGFTTTDAEAIHVIGDVSGTVEIGGVTFAWGDGDSVADNGLELIAQAAPTVEPTPEVVTGWATIDGGFTYLDATTEGAAAFTVTGYTTDEDGVLGPDGISYDSVSGGLVFADGFSTTDAEALHVVGVTEGATVEIGGVTFAWGDGDSVADNGLELIAQTAPEPTVPASAWTATADGFTYDDGQSQFTIAGYTTDADANGEPDAISVSAGVLTFGDGFSTTDAAAIHVLGDVSGTVEIGGVTFAWGDADSDASNGLELIAQTPEPTVPASNWTATADGFTYDDGTAQFTIAGYTTDADANGEPDAISVAGGALVFGDGFSTTDAAAIHVLGNVTEGATVAIGGSTFTWGEYDSDTSDGLELTIVGGSDTTSPVTISPWVPLETGGFSYDSNGTTFTITGSAVTDADDDGNPDGISVSGSTITFASGFNTAGVHVQGLSAGTLVNVGTTTYQLQDTDSDTSNGLEIAEYVEPQVLDHILVDSTGNVHYIDRNDAEIDATDTAVSEIVKTIANGVQFVTDDHNYDVISEKDGIIIADENGNIIGGINQGDIYSDGSITEDDGEDEDGDTTFTNPQNAWYYEPAADSDEVGVLYITANDEVEIDNITVSADTKVSVEYNDDEEIVSVTLDNVTLGADAEYDGDTIHGFDAASQTGAVVITFNSDDEPQIASYIEPTKAAWTAVDGGFVYESDTTTFTVSGSAFVDQSPMDNIPDGVSVVDGALQFTGEFDTTPANFHVAGTGIAEGVKVTVNGAALNFYEGDNDTVNGFEVTDIVTGWQKVSDTEYTYRDSYADDSAKFTVTADSFTDVDGIVGPDNISVANGALVFGDDFNASVNIHALGVTEGDTVQINGREYAWADTDGDSVNGFELNLVENDWTVNADGSFTYSDSDGTTFNITGVEDADSNGIPDGVSVVDGVIYGVPTSATVAGQTIGVTEPESADGIVSIALSDGSIATVGGVSEGATVETARFVTFDADATGITAAQGSHNLNGNQINILNDANGIEIKLSDGSIVGYDGLAAGASIAGTGFNNAPVTVGGASALTTTGIGQRSFTTDDSDGYVVANNTITGINNGTLLEPDSTGTYYVNGARLALSNSDDSIQGYGDSARIYTPAMAAADSLAPDLSRYDTVAVATNEGGIDTTGWGNYVSATLDSALNSALGIDDYNFDTVNAVMALTMTDGDQDVTLPNRGGSTAIVDASATGTKNIKGGDHTNTLINSAAGAVVNMRGGTQADTISAAGGNLETIDLQDGGADRVYAVNGANITGYDPTTGAALIVEGVLSDIAAGTMYYDDGGNLQSGDKTFQFNEGQGTDDEEGNLTVNFIDPSDTTSVLTVSFANSNADAVDRSSATGSEVLVGNFTRSNVDKSGASLLGGSIADTIFAGANDVVNGNGGSDIVSISSDRDPDAGTTVQIAVGGGHDTIYGFKTGFDEDADLLSIPDVVNGRASLSFEHNDDGSLEVAIGAIGVNIMGVYAVSDSDTTTADSDTTAALADEDDGVTTTATSGSGVAQIKIQNRADDNNVTNYTVIDANNVAVVDAEADLENSKFVGLGDGAIVDFSEYESDDVVVINLGDTETYSSITGAAASNGEVSLVGAAGKTGEILMAGLGDGTVDANTGGNALLFGRALAEDKEGSTSFVFGSGYGIDTLYGFTALTGDNEDIADRIVINGDYDATAVGGMLGYNAESDTMTMTVSRRDQLVVADVLEDGATEAQLQIGDAAYKVGTSMTYGEDVAGYVAQENGAIVAGEDDEVENVDLWLALGSNGESYNIGYDGKTYNNIKDVDVSGAVNATIAGNMLENYIIGASGDNSLWGGTGGAADTLVGNAEGQTQFFYLNGNGDDVFITENENDVVNLLNIGLEEINWNDIEMEEDKVAVGMNDGSKFQVNSSADVTFQLNNGSQWVADRENKTWRYKGQA